MRALVVVVPALLTGVLAACERSEDASATSTAVSTSASTAAGGSAHVGGAGAAATGSGGNGGTTAGDTCGVGTGAPAAGGRVRVVAANLSSGDGQSYDSGHGVRILQGLDADVILLQEMNYGDQSRTAIDTLVDDVCAGECRYVRGPQAQIPNGVLTRLPIVDCGTWPDPEVDNRNFVWARIDVAGPADLWAISVHLLSTGSSARALEVNALLNHIAGVVPAGDLIVLGGDLNTDTRTETAVTSLSPMFDTAGPFPVDHGGNGMTNAPRSKPYDWVLANVPLAAKEVVVTVGGSMFAAGAVIDTRVYVPLAEIAPALVNDSAAPSMQHMAVVKDFLIE